MYASTYAYIYIYILYIYIYICEQQRIQKLLNMKVTIISIVIGGFGTVTKGLLKEGARGVMVITVGNGHGDTSSNPGRD